MKVGIIGAGLTGLIIYRELSLLGCDVTILEKSRGIGGRIATKRLPWANVDLGAQHFSANDPRFIDEVLKCSKSRVAEGKCDDAVRRLREHCLEPGKYTVHMKSWNKNTILLVDGERLTTDADQVM